MPMCRKVESPITARMRLSLSASPRPLSRPRAMPIEAPIEMRGVERVPRMAGAQRVAADVAGDGEVLQLRQRVIDAEVRAGDAHRRRPREDLHRRGRRVGLPARARRAGGRWPGFSTFGASSPWRGRMSLPMTGDALRLEFGLDQRLDFLDHHQPVDRGGEGAASSRAAPGRRSRASAPARRGRIRGRACRPGRR